MPQSYLRRFAADPPLNSKIWRLSKSIGLPERKPIAKVAVKHHLYTPIVDGKRDISFERRLSELEQWFGSELWMAASRAFIDLNDETVRKVISLLASVMFLRNPKRLELTNKVHCWLLNGLKPFEGQPMSLEIGNRFGSKTSELDWSNFAEFENSNEEDIKRQWLAVVGGATSLAKLLMEMRWAVVFSDEPYFVTSDNPVSHFHPSLRFNGFKDADSTTIFPLGPTRLLVMDNRHSEPDGRYYPLNPECSWNSMIWQNALDFMFSSRNPETVCREIDEQANEAGY